MWPVSKDGRIERLIVFLDRGGVPVPVGALQFEGRGAARLSRFQYAASWLARPDVRPIDPIGLPLRRKPAVSAPYEAALAFYDAGPDGWGKDVLSAAFPDQVFRLAEYLAAAGDDRTGDLRFGPTPDAGPGQWVPGDALISLPDGTETLEDLTEAAEAVEAGIPRRHHLELLFRSSADVGGARPKARIRRDGHGWIAKFSARGDAFDEPRVEAACLSLARACGIAVPEHEAVTVAGRSVLLVKRFDRTGDGRRLGYLSAATILRQPPADYATRFTCTDIAAAARAMGAAPCEEEVFRRLLFNCAIHNTDDHLRNTAFIHDGGWRLSPAFDLMCHRAPHLVVRPARGADPLPDLDKAFATFPAFGLDAAAAGRVREEIERGLRQWPHLLDRFAVTARDRAAVAQRTPYLR